MARILVTTHPHEGHLNPTFSISHQLVAQGHEVIYLDHPLIRKLITEQGFPAVPFRGLRPGDISLLWHKYRVEHSQGVEEMRNAILVYHSTGGPGALHPAIDRATSTGPDIERCLSLRLGVGRRIGGSTLGGLLDGRRDAPPS